MSANLDDRYRDENGEIRKKQGNTRVVTLRKIYGPEFAQDHRGDKKLENVLKDEHVTSLSQLLRKKKG